MQRPLEQFTAFRFPESVFQICDITGKINLFHNLKVSQNYIYHISCLDFPRKPRIYAVIYHQEFRYITIHVNFGKARCVTQMFILQ